MKTTAENLREVAARVAGRGEMCIIMSTTAAWNIAAMLDLAWEHGSPELRRLLCNHDEGLADKWMADISG